MAYLRGTPYVYWSTAQYGDSEQLQIDYGSRGNAQVSYELCKARPEAVTALFGLSPGPNYEELLDAMRCFCADVEFKEQQDAIKRKKRRS